MGEEQKEEEKKEDVKEEEKKEEQDQEIVLRVDMHCEGCAKKVAKALRGFEGVEEVKTDSKARLVVVKGKAADPVKVCERVQRKTGRKTELISPIPKPPEEDNKEEAKDVPQEEKEEPKAITVILKVRMHCESCAQFLHKRIKKLEGVESVVTDMSNNQITVTGFIDPEKLVDYVSKRTKRQALIVKGEEEEKKEEEKGEEQEKKEDDEKKGEDDEKKIELQKYEHWSSPGYYHIEYAYDHPPPQIFSDENPNACFVM
ncbi:hypothetical protein J5N97_010183 [Dioscorea zingiberensis]|uniref:HMA domain-containing protein n=1 Tax=Dioscorea zingiberensis TaxID=325984 RepID=A0A9D5CYX5_9LILI|nr:hypothetical protein J5N97_010183 [Dioscorea zingiberensis]